MGDNYFDIDEEHVLHDAYAMIRSDRTDYESLEDVLIGETTFDGESLDAYMQLIEDVTPE